MHISITTINVGKGDCIGIQMSEGNDSFNILIDCGNYNDNVKNFVKCKFHNQINLLVATHIDDDHIAGLSTMLTDGKSTGLTVEKIWFNCFQHISQKDRLPLTDEVKTKIEHLRTKLKLSLEEKIHNISITDAKTLSEEILENWSGNWEKTIIIQGYTKELGDGRWGTIKVIAPTANNWEKTGEDYTLLFMSELLADQYDNYSNCEYIYEILNRLSTYEEEKEIGQSDMGYGTLTREDLEGYCSAKQKSDSSKSNRTSIAFVLEVNDHRFLFSGDTIVKNIIDGIKTLYPTEETVFFDAIKVAHHGSECNTSKKLMEKIDSGCYIITGAEEGTRPSFQTLSRIINRPVPEKASFTKRVIHCNAWANQLESFAKAEDLMNELHYKIEYQPVNI